MQFLTRLFCDRLVKRIFMRRTAPKWTWSPTRCHLERQPTIGARLIINMKSAGKAICFINASSIRCIVPTMPRRGFDSLRTGRGARDIVTFYFSSNFRAMLPTSMTQTISVRTFRSSLDIETSVFLPMFYVEATLAIFSFSVIWVIIGPSRKCHLVIVSSFQTVYAVCYSPTT